ncbi:histidine ammonia-lyase [Aliidiomarina sedimenti]|uniref:Histidine ammonia-lyase n=1 Tax=Aliidiomarina sedimenti TaxID=1933879 RepID=A0ABY0BVT9_9GAMM|nr:histidine ammonia-lyase [Aliidiomarina sedimenti]
MVVFGEQRLTIEDVVAIAFERADAVISEQDEFAQRIHAGEQFIQRLLHDEGAVYGVTTGYGDSCTVAVPQALTSALPVNLTRFHGCGLGDMFSATETRAILAVRLCSLTQGYSGVSMELLKYLALMLKHNILPLIPQEGSVGASGDLTPLSYVAGALIGEREVTFRGQTMLAADAFAQLGVDPYQLKPKEALAIMNGTAVMTAIACLAWRRADYLSRLSTRVTALACVGVAGNPYHFDETLFAVKPHAGQQQVAAWLREDLLDTEASRNTARLQDRYSLRCAPHIIGVLCDTLPFLQHTIENELNSANDNPIIDPVGERVLHGGHFYGGHIAMAMDTLKTLVANLADLHDRQMALMLDARTNNGLAANLSAATGAEASINHGFKAVQIGCSAWAAEALKHTMPASVFSRSTECHNQDKVSMGTIAARDAMRVLELTEQVVVATMLAAWQASQLRLQFESGVPASEQLLNFMQRIDEDFVLLESDRRLDHELRFWLQEVRAEALDLYVD